MLGRDTVPYALIAGSILILFALVHSISGPTGPHAESIHSTHRHNHSSSHSKHSAGEHSNMDMMMPMWFMWTFDTILWFHSWHPTTLLPYLGTVALLLAVAVTHEALASYRVSWSKSHTQAVAAAAGYEPVPGGRKRLSMLQLRAVNSLLYTANITTGYFLMLAVMSFNVGYFIAVVVGMGLGHFLFFNKPWHLEFTRVDACCETTVGFQP